MRKVLSFVLVLALVLGSFSFAFGLTDIEDSANSEAITVANNLGIITGFPDGTFKPDQAVNRAEFAAMITRALGVPESALAGFSATSFKDTSGYTWAVPYLAFCESKGIMLGDGYGNAMPGRTINLNEAITMVLRAVGYTENSAVLVGMWPSNYVSLAQDLDLYDSVANMVTVDRANAAQVIYNALTVPKVQVAADGATSEIGQTVLGVWVPSTMLTSGLGCKHYAPAGYAAGEAWVVEGDEDSLINLSKYVGAFVTAYSNKDDEIVAVNDVKSTYLVGEFDITPAGGAVLTDVNDNEYTVTAYSYTDGAGTAGTPVVEFYNGIVDAASLVAAADTEYTVAAKVSGKRLLEVYSIAEWDADVTFQFDDGDLDLEDCELAGEPFVQTNNETIDYDTFKLLGVASLEDIDEDNVVYIYKAAAASAVHAIGDITRVSVGTETVTGEVSKVSGGKYTIGGTVYELSAETTPTVTLGDKGTAYLDYDGKVAYWDVDDAASGNFAVLIATQGATSFGVTTVEVKLFTKDGVVIEPAVKDSVSAAAVGITIGANGTLVEYSLDKNGKVDSIALASTTAALNGKVNADNTLIGTARMDAGVVVFLYDAGDDEYSIGTVADFDKDVTITTAATTISAVKSATTNRITAILINDDIVDGGDSVYGVINTTSKALDADGDAFLGLAGFKGENAAAFDLLTNAGSPYTAFTKTASTGALQVITVNASGVITGVANAVAGTNADAVYNSTATVSAVDGNFITVDGGVYRLADNAVIYMWDADNSKWVVKTAKSTLKGKFVKLYESDAGSTDYVYDYVLAR